MASSAATALAVAAAVRFTGKLLPFAQFEVVSQPENKLALTNHIFFSPDRYDEAIKLRDLHSPVHPIEIELRHTIGGALESCLTIAPLIHIVAAYVFEPPRAAVYIAIQNCVYIASAHEQIPSAAVGLNRVQRLAFTPPLERDSHTKIDAILYVPPLTLPPGGDSLALHSARIEFRPVYPSGSRQALTFRESELCRTFRVVFMDHIFRVGQNVFHRTDHTDTIVGTARYAPMQYEIKELTQSYTTGGVANQTLDVAAGRLTASTVLHITPTSAEARWLLERDGDGSGTAAAAAAAN